LDDVLKTSIHDTLTYVYIITWQMTVYIRTQSLSLHHPSEKMGGNKH